MTRSLGFLKNKVKPFRARARDNDDHLNHSCTGQFSLYKVTHLIGSWVGYMAEAAEAAE